MIQSNRFLPYTRWPDALARHYRARVIGAASR